MASDERGFEFRVEPRDRYVYVWQGGMAETLEQLEVMQREIESAMKQVGTRFCMFDNRDTIQPDQLIRAAMWTWLTEHVLRAALLQNEAKNIARAERTGERNRVSVRAFHDEAEAEGWLQQKSSPS